MRQVMTYYPDGDIALPEFTPTYHISSSTMILEQSSEAFNMYNMSSQKFKASNGSISSLSGGDNLLYVCTYNKSSRM